MFQDFSIFSTIPSDDLDFRCPKKFHIFCKSMGIGTFHTEQWVQAVLHRRVCDTQNPDTREKCRLPAVAGHSPVFYFVYHTLKRNRRNDEIAQLTFEERLFSSHFVCGTEYRKTPCKSQQQEYQALMYQRDTVFLHRRMVSRECEAPQKWERASG